MRNVTKCFYQNNIWEKIVNHPKYNLGKRELRGLISFLRDFVIIAENVIHLGIGGEREVPHLIKYIKSVENYVLVDICSDVLMSTYLKVVAEFPDVNFQKKLGDVEDPDFFPQLRKKISGSALIALVGNGVIFSNRSVDEYIFNGMKNGDLFLLTLETPHAGMASSYNIEPAYELISKGDIKASRKNTKIIYDYDDHCLKMICEGITLLSSYKPTLEQLRNRMKKAGFRKEIIREHEEIHMIGSLWRKE